MNKELLNYFNGDELAANVWLSKYAEDGEVTPDDMHKRMAKEFARIESNYKDTKTDLVSDYAKTREPLTEDKIYNLFKDFKYIVPQGSIMSQLGAKSIGSLSNCFVIGQPEDSYGGIFQKDEQMAQLMKRRGGVGLDISSLRPEGTPTSNAAKSSTGPVSFMERYSNTTREVAQDGRRGALMITIDCRHPDVFDFVNIKKDRTKVTGANISVNLRDDFMKAVEADEDYILRWPCEQDLSYFSDEYLDVPYNYLTYLEDHKRNNAIFYIKKIRAKELYDSIVENAWDNAEPGQMFIDRHWDYSPDCIYPQYKGVTTNPCGEIFMQPYDACRLIAVNLYSFVDNPFTSKSRFNFKKFYEFNYEAMRLSDDLIDLEVEHIDRIIHKIQSDAESVKVRLTELELWMQIRDTAKASRRAGLGFTALGDTLAALGFKYDSDAALDMVDQIMKTKMESELDCIIDMSITRGAFEGCDTSKEFEYKDTEEEGVRQLYGKNPFYQFIAQNFKQAKKMHRYGRRNVSWSTVAPTGTVKYCSILQ